MHRQFTPDVYTVGEHENGTHLNKIRTNRRCYSEQLVRNRAKVSSPSSYSLNSSIAYESASLHRSEYSPKKLFPVASPASNRRGSVCCTPTQNINSSSFDKYSPIADYSSLCVRSTPTQTGTPSFDKYMSPYGSPRQSVRSASISNFSLDAGGNNWSLLSNNTKTPTRARACSIDSPQNLGQLLSLHFSPCSCKNNSKRMSLASPAVSEPFARSSSASTPSLSYCPESSLETSPSRAATSERWRPPAKEIPSPLNIYLHTRKRHARGSEYHCNTCK